MKISILTFAILVFFGQFTSFSEDHKGHIYNDLVWGGDYIVYKNKKIELGPQAFFIDGELSNEEAAKYPYVFNSVNDATLHLTDGTEDNPMVLYIAPWVYWIDNPDDPEIRIPKEGNYAPFGLEIKCEWLKFHGLSEDAANVVLACNRGQTMGAKGNFTMLNISGQGTSSENITFGNYCNIDLKYPLKPELGREKRGSAIVQAQLIFCNGDKIVARNTRFVSRLNLCPFLGSKRTLFDQCHFESTDDALNGTAVYLNCTFDFYASKPFGGTRGTGAVFLNCDIRSFTRGEQYLIKSIGPITLVDTRMQSETVNYWGWKEEPEKENRNYQYRNFLNDKDAYIGTHHPYATIDMTDKKVLDAFRFEYQGKIYYNIYNLLRGNDDWDPMDQKEIVLAAEKQNGKMYSDVPTQILIKPTRITIETGKENALLEATVNKFGNYEVKDQKIRWSVAPEYKAFVELKDLGDGTCEVIATNNEDETKEVIIIARTNTGLEAASVVHVAPSFLEAPKFSTLPEIIQSSEGKLAVKYKLDMRFEDQSLISWYRCADKEGINPIEIAVSRMNKPLMEYSLSNGDIGYFIMTKIQPKHVRCNAGEAVNAIFSKPITKADVKSDNRNLVANFKIMSGKYQPEIIPGFWTLDSYAPIDTREQNWEGDNSRDPWYYGIGEGGAASDTGFVQNTKGARMRYTPVGETFGDMKISFTACPAKTAGQGFSSARAQYMDICFKFDTKSLTGYALRLIRTTKYHDAIDCVFMKYENGKAVPIGEPVSTSCYRTPCFITLEVIGNKIKAHAETPAQYLIEPNRPEVVQVLDMETNFEPNNFGGIEFQHTGTVNSGATLIKDLKVEWK